MGYIKKFEVWIISQGYFGETALEEPLIEKVKS